MFAYNTVLEDSPIKLPQRSRSASNVHRLPQKELTFYYFAYGSCMCPVDLKRSLGENTHPYVLGSAILKGYRLGFYWHSRLRNCGMLDMVPDPTASVEGVLYRLPMRLSNALDEREQVPSNGYRHETIEVAHGKRVYSNVRTYVVVNKHPEELAPNDWYSSVVLRGATTCGLSEEYCWKLFNHMHQLQERQQYIQSSPTLKFWI